MIKFLKSRVQVFCAFCRHQRLVYRKKSLSAFDIAMVAFLSLLTVLVLFHQMDPRAFVFFAFYMAIGELFVQVRWKLKIVCPHCGFDPSLYLRSQPAALEKVKKHIERRKTDPAFLLKPALFSASQHRPKDALFKSNTGNEKSLQARAPENAVDHKHRG
jgi:hypothetical protein